MGAHETADAVLTRDEADRLRNRALEQIAELDGIAELPPAERCEALWRWAGRVWYTLGEVARG